jgi:MoaA/NifB/PqqE/SkfB family radical SAM enzyme
MAIERGIISGVVETEAKRPLIGVCLFTTHECNMFGRGCPGCWRGDDGLRIDPAIAMDLHTDIVDRLAQSGVLRISFAGGEPLVAEHAPELIAYAHSLGIKTGLQTNGIRLREPDIMARLEGHVSEIILPLEGATALTHAKVRGSKDHHQLVLDILPEVRQRFPWMEISTIVTRQNVHELPQLAEIVAASGADKWKLSQYYALDRGKKHKDRYALEADHFLEASGAVTDALAARGIIVDAQVRTTQRMQSYFNITAGGDVVLDDGNGEYGTIGNVFETAPIDLWNSHPAFDRMSQEVHMERHSGDIGAIPLA